jgi:hypothetical protein
MAFFALGDNHFIRVRLMAFGAFWDLTVDVVAFGTIKN